VASPLSHWQAAEGKPAPWSFATILLAPDRAWLRDRIETRFDAMLKEGVLAESARRARAQARADMAGVEKAHGAPELFRHFRGNLSSGRLAVSPSTTPTIRQAPDDVVSASDGTRSGRGPPIKPSSGTH